MYKAGETISDAVRSDPPPPPPCICCQIQSDLHPTALRLLPYPIGSVPPPHDPPAPAARSSSRVSSLDPGYCSLPPERCTLAAILARPTCSANSHTSVESEGKDAACYRLSAEHRRPDWSGQTATAPTQVWESEGQDVKKAPTDSSINRSAHYPVNDYTINTLSLLAWAHCNFPLPLLPIHTPCPVGWRTGLLS